jgi:hypothetical protein
MSRRHVVLREIKEQGDWRHLEASINDAGDLVIKGTDYGDAVEKHFGVREYEWVWTIRASDMPKLLESLDTTGEPIEALSSRFSGDEAAGLKAFLDANNIPHEAWSRLGD